MFDDVATLKAIQSRTYDVYGNELIVYKDTTVFVKPSSVYASEFYNAAQIGLNPSITFELTNKADYNGENIIKFNGTYYKIIRSDWKSDRDAIRLICEEVDNINEYIDESSSSSESGSGSSSSSDESSSESGGS